MKFFLVLIMVVSFFALAPNSIKHQLEPNCYQDPETLSTFIPKATSNTTTSGVLIINDFLEGERIVSSIEAKIETVKLNSFNPVKCPNTNL